MMHHPDTSAAVYVKTGKPQLAPLTSIRGIAAFWVYLYHCQFLTSPSPFFNTLKGMGYYGVDMFFLLSGFVIAYVHLEEFSTPAELKRNARRFLLLRLGRIYPLHIVTLLVLVALLKARIIGIDPKTTTAWQFVCNLLLLQSTPLVQTLNFNAITWSVSVEWVLYLCFPVFALLIASKTRDCLSNLLLFGVSFSLCMWYLNAHNINLSESYVPGRSILRGACSFVLGVAMHNLFRQGFLKRYFEGAAAILCPLLLLVIVWFRSRGTWANESVMLLLFASWIYALAHAKGWAAHVYSVRPLLYLGEISYSLYMWHFILGVVIWQRFVKLLGEHPSFFSWQFVGMTFVFLGTAGASFHLIEIPARKWARAAAARVGLRALAQSASLHKS